MKRILAASWSPFSLYAYWVGEYFLVKDMPKSVGGITMVRKRGLRSILYYAFHLRSRQESILDFNLELGNFSLCFYSNITLKILLMGGTAWKTVLPANLACPRAQNLIAPWKLDDPSCQIENSARGRRFWAYWKLHIFHRKKNLSHLGLKLCAMAR